MMHAVDATMTAITPPISTPALEGCACGLRAENGNEWGQGKARWLPACC